MLLPVAMMIRFAVLAPLSAMFPKLRRVVVAKYSGLKINPAFERREPEGELRTQWFWQELGASVFSIALLAAGRDERDPAARLRYLSRGDRRGWR